MSAIDLKTAAEQDHDQLQDVWRVLSEHHYDYTYGPAHNIIRRILEERDRLADQCLRLMVEPEDPLGNRIDH